MTERLRVAEKNIRVTRNEFAVADALVRAAPDVVKKQVLLARLGYAPTAQTFTLKTTVARLRRKLGAEGDRIKAVAGTGYRLAPPAAK